MLKLDTYADYREAWDNAIQALPSAPLNLDLEISSACNLSCGFCYHANPKWSFPRQLIPTALAVRALSDAKQLGVPAVKLNYRGEPTLHPDFSFIAQWARLQGFHDVIVNSNFNFTNYGKVALGLASCTKVMVSLDSLRAETYAQMRAGGKILTVIDNVLSALKSEVPLVLRRVLTDKNRMEDFRADCVRYFGERGYEVRETESFDRSGPACVSDMKRARCPDPFRRMVLGADGVVLACCGDWRGEYPTGKYPHESLLDLWSGPAMRRAREGNMEHCGRCESWRGYEHANAKLLEEAGR